MAPCSTRLPSARSPIILAVDDIQTAPLPHLFSERQRRAPQTLRPPELDSRASRGTALNSTLAGERPPDALTASKRLPILANRPGSPSVTTSPPPQLPSR